MQDDDGRPVWYRLLFTKDDDLDLTQIYFGVAVLFSIVAFSLAGAGTWDVSTAAWAFLGSVFATLAITGTPQWVATLLARSKTPGEVASGIASAGERPYGPDTRQFNVTDYLSDDDVRR